MIFLDEAEIQVVAGNGGNGCLAFRREKFEPRGGPSGGDGGRGGSVFLVGETGRNTLYHLRGHRRYVAERGRHGEGSNRTGRDGVDRIVSVPLGTVAIDRDTGEIVGELLEDGDRLQVAIGGRGGRGNARFKSATNRAPRHHEPGREGSERWLKLELKLLADVGLVGLPNAGKSTLISALSAARPKVADYPFTTIIPNLGVVAEGPLDTPFIIADLPGLIRGAADGAGLGHQFLRHIERCRVLAHLVELGGIDDDEPEDQAARELATIEEELRAFDPDLLQRPRVIIGSKRDTARPPRQSSLRDAAEARGLPYLEVSAATRHALDPLTSMLRRMLDAASNESEEP